MNYDNRRYSIALFALTCLVWAGTSPLVTHAQLQGAPGGRFSIVGAFDDAAGGDPATVSAQFVPAMGEHPAVLVVTARMQPGWHTYALTQPRGKSGGPQATKIKLTPSPHYHLLAPFRANPQPKSHIDQEAWIGLELQEHDGEVDWYAPIELAAGSDPAKVEINGLVDMQVCKEQCVPQKVKFVARQASREQAAKVEQLFAVDAMLATIKAPQAMDPRISSKGSFQSDGSVVKITGRLEPATVRPGEAARLTLATTTTRGWHLYTYADRDDKPGSKPTLIAFENAWGLTVYRPKTDAPITTDNSVPNFPPMHYHEGPATWTIDIDVPADAEPGAYPITGVIGYQACEFRSDGTGSCEIPKAARFNVTLNVGNAAAVGNGQVTFAPTTYKDAATAAAAWADVLDGQPAKPDRTAVTNTNDVKTVFVGPGDPNVPSMKAANQYDLTRIQIQEPSGSLLGYIALAFLGGVILNLMPCVLPVIGLKVMSFVQQAGKSRGHALALNGWYALGIVSVFVLLGVLAATIGLQWGGQFSNVTFNVTMAAVVFAMALSLLGVWEVPIPGFFGTGAVQDAAAKEGPSGAFLKGVVTTVLATPCGAPYMAPAIAWAVGQPTQVTLAVFASVGFGMASPYLLVGMFPELLRFLPKPGRWMETFKQLTGFVLLATVVYILSFVEAAAVVPTLLLLVGIGMACWLFARTPATADFHDRRRAWVLSGVVTGAFAIAAFGWLYPSLKTVVREGWEPFSLARLQQLTVEEGRTVLVDFSAEWCPTCKFLERTVLHTTPVEQAIDQSGAVRLYADFTNYPPEIADTIKQLKSSGVPVIAVFPGDRPYEPIVFRGGYKQADIIAALASAKQRSGIISSQSALGDVTSSRQ